MTPSSLQSTVEHANRAHLERRNSQLVTPVFANTSADALNMVNPARIDDERWSHLTGGYKIPFDPRPPLAKLENQRDTKTAWQELGEELHHQGDVGDASYAAIPELV